MESMHAVILNAYGGPEVLQFEEVPRPEPVPGEVLVRVQAATVNHTDMFLRSGHTQFVTDKPFPHILGMDVAGEIVALGEGERRWRVGDRVVATFEALGRDRNGGYAEYVTLPVEQLHRIPQGVSYVAAASLGLAWTTAWVASNTATQIEAADRIVIHAASSGVGTALIQIAHWRGAQVIVISDPDKADRLRELGADSVLDRDAPDLVAQVMALTNNAGATLVYELIGRDTLQTSLDLLAQGGRIICVGMLSGDLSSFRVMDLVLKSATIRGSYAYISHENFALMLHLFAEGIFQPVIDSVLPLSEARAAHERLEARTAFGKIVLAPFRVQ